MIIICRYLSIFFYVLLAILEAEAAARTTSIIVYMLIWFQEFSAHFRLASYYFFHFYTYILLRVDQERL